MTVYPISDKRHQQALCDAKKRRLQVLELQAAFHGISVPPHIAIEIENLHWELVELKKKVKEDLPIRFRVKLQKIYVFGTGWPSNTNLPNL